MANKIIGYWAILYLVGNIFSQYMLLNPLADITFNVLILVGFLINITKIQNLSNKQIVKANSFIFAYAAIMIVYQATFGMQHINEKTWTYLVAKIVADFAFIISIAKMPSFYKEKAYPLIAVFTAILIAVGIVYGGGGLIINGRMTYGFGNSNSLGAIGAICAGALFISAKKLKVWQWLVVGICAFGALKSGSRTGTAMLLLSLLLKYGIHKRTILVLIISYLSLQILHECGINFVGLDRFFDSVQEGNFDDTRYVEREATLLMIRTNPIEGNGLYAQQSREAAMISELGSHNGYLDLVKFMGIPLGGLVILFLLQNVRMMFKRFFTTEDLNIRAHVYVVVATLLAAMNEAYIWGVNQMVTTMMFISLTTLGYFSIVKNKK